VNVRIHVAVVSLNARFVKNGLFLIELPSFFTLLALFVLIDTRYCDLINFFLNYKYRFDRLNIIINTF
jgi:hypothetical protein